MLNLIALLSVTAPIFAHYGAKYEPPDGKIYHGSGWDYNGSQRIYEEMFPEGYYPIILQSNVSIPGTRGFDVERAVQSLTRNIVHSDSQYCEFSMHWQGRDTNVMLDSIYVFTDQWDHWVDTLEVAFRQVNKPFFFRIGFEFNGSWNPYHPYIYPRAFRKLVLELRRRGIDNFATVWCYEPDADATFADSTRQGWRWYPGDDVVDWFGLDLFNHSHFDPAEPDSLRGQLTRKGKAEAFLRFAEARGKPVYLNELSAIDVSVTPDSLDIDSADGRHDWETWFVPFFDFVAAHPIIKGWNYINVNWTVVGHYGQLGWQDARLEINSYIKNRWVQHLIEERFIHAGYDITQEMKVKRYDILSPSLIRLEAYPNPFNSILNIMAYSPKGKYSISIYTISGQELETIYNNYTPADPVQLMWQDGYLPARTYILQMISDGKTINRKLELIK